MKEILEPARRVPVIDEADICVLGGGCAGVFAAVRAARLGMRVVLVEKQNSFGGTATQAMVCNWHSIWDEDDHEQIIAGLTWEVIQDLARRDAILTNKKNKLGAFIFNPEELKLELDQLLLKAGVKIWLHTAFSSPYLENGELKAVIVENKSGRGAIFASCFIDATGDGDLAHSLELTRSDCRLLQPPTLLAKVHWSQTKKSIDMQKMLREHREQYGLKADTGFSMTYPGIEQVQVHVETHVFGADCSDARQLTAAEIEGRRHIRAWMEMVQTHGPQDNKLTLLDIACHIGIRETRHIFSRYRLTEKDLLSGRRYEDAIANGSYPVDIHSPDKPAVLLKYLNGRQQIKEETRIEETRWREEGDDYARFWQIPYRSLLPQKHDNLICCGRMLDADEGAYGAVRVTVVTNQTGEAAGVAASLAVKNKQRLCDVDTAELRRLLAEGGSKIL